MNMNATAQMVTTTQVGCGKAPKKPGIQARMNVRGAEYMLVSEHYAILNELTEQNKTFRAAQKACEDCDGPTMAEVQQLREQLAAERKERAIIERSRDAWKRQVAELGKQLAAERQRGRQELIDELKSYMEKQ